MSTKEVVVKNSWPWGMILFLIFMVLKLTGHITWSWWWVTAPLWIPVGLGLVFGIGVLLFAAALYIIAAVIDEIQSYKRKKR